MYKTILTGNLGADATVSQSGDWQVINFNVAVQVRKDFTQWVECAYWRKSDQSVAIADYLTKGKKIMVEGECAADVWENKPKLKCRVLSIELLSSHEGNN